MLVMVAVVSGADDPRPAFDDWGGAGYPGGIPNVATNVLDVRAFGALGNGITDDAAAIQAAIDAAPDPAVVFFSAGSYRIEAELELTTGVVLRGEGYRESHIECLNAGGCLRIQGTRTGDFVDAVGGLDIGSTEITVTQASGFTVGEGAEIQQENVIPPWATWGENSIGQMLKVVAIDGNTLTVEPALNFNYGLGYDPQVRPVRFVERVGIEDLRLHRISSGLAEDSSNVNIVRAADCWIRRVESDDTEKYHFAVSESLHLEIRECYVHDAESKGDGGEGYGASLGRHATGVLVENCIFDELRHSMIIQLGTNGCVFGYNYAQHNYSDDGWDKSYISLHGHYPFLNLFEGNVVGWAYMGDYWGEIGPDNTLFRNWVIGTDKHQEFGPYRGIGIRYFDGPQHVVGNEVSGGDGIYFAPDATGNPDDVVIHGNNVLGTVTFDPNYPQTLADSYYLESKPGFYGGLAWPSVGGDQVYGESTIPALLRWQSGNYIPEAAEIFADGFESGGTTAWSTVEPLQVDGDPDR